MLLVNLIAPFPLGWSCPRKIDYEIIGQKILTREYFLMYVRVAILILAVKG